MRFIIEEQGNKRTSKKIKLLTGEELSLLDISNNPLGLGQIDTSNEVDKQPEDNTETPSEEKDEMISNNLSTFDNSIQKLGISQEEWNTLSKEEQDRIKKCN